MKAWLVINNWRDKYPDLLDGYFAKLFRNENNAKKYYGNLRKTDNAILKEIDLPDLASHNLDKGVNQ